MFKTILATLRSNKKAIKKALLITLSIMLSYLMFFNYIDYHQVMISRNVLTGKTSIDKTQGLKVSPPWVIVNRIDTRPHRICITSASRNYNCTLVSFDPNGWEEFIEMEGFYYYWWANRISYNSGHSLEYRGFSNILKGYCFDNKGWKFIKVHQELGK